MCIFILSAQPQFPLLPEAQKNKAEAKKSLSKQNQWLFFFLQTIFSSLILSPGMIFPFQKAVWRTIHTEPLKARENHQKAAPLCCVLLTLICKPFGYWCDPCNLFAPSLHISCPRIWLQLDSLYAHIDYSRTEVVYNFCSSLGLPRLIFRSLMCGFLGHLLPDA